MGRTACTEPQYSYTPTPPMDRTACTEPQYSYTSTPPIGRTVCTEPQCLYKGALYLTFIFAECKKKSLSRSLAAFSNLLLVPPIQIPFSSSVHPPFCWYFKMLTT